MKRLMIIFTAASMSFLLLSIHTEIRAQEPTEVPGQEATPKTIPEDQKPRGAIVRKKPSKKALKELNKELKKKPVKKKERP
jgi:hypothetical protein